MDRKPTRVNTLHLPDRGECTATYAGRVLAEKLTEEERALIKDGTLGYCEGHRVLYYKWALHSCLVPMIFPEATIEDCKEWKADEQNQ